MPNHVQHNLHIKNMDHPSAAEFFAKMGDGFDFNALLPRPELVQLPDGTDGIRCDVVAAAAHCASLIAPGCLKHKESAREGQFFDPSRAEAKGWTDVDWRLFARCVQSSVKHGFIYWHDWSVVNWGTKWNAYDVAKTADGYKFQTAWSTPEPVIRAIAAAFPFLEIDIDYADEDYGRNCGTWGLSGGEVVLVEKDGQDFFVYWVWYGDKAEEMMARDRAED